MLGNNKTHVRKLKEMRNHKTVKMKVTANYQFLSNLRNRTDKAVLEGSTRSTKTYSIIQFLIVEKILKAEISIRCFRHDSVTHNKSTIKDFKDIMSSLNLFDSKNWNGTDKIYKFDNGSTFSFDSANDDSKLHGCKQSIAWLNEVMEISFDAYTQILYRTTDLIILDFNPSFNNHWVFDSVIPLETTEYKHSTYLDNPFLSDAQTKGIESFKDTPANRKTGTFNQWKWDVYGLGKRGKVEGAIFKIFDLTDFFPDKYQCSRYGFGLDFGYSVDPSALIECAVHQDNLYVREIVYETGLLTTRNISQPSEPNLDDIMRESSINNHDRIYADCSASEEIADLQMSGYNIFKSKKGAGSIMAGINLMKERRIYICRKSINLQLEFERYSWKKIKTDDGKTFRDVPEDRNNHGIDAIRYFCLSELKIDKIEKNQPSKSVKSVNVFTKRRRR